MKPRRGELTQPRPTAWARGPPSVWPPALKGRNAVHKSPRTVVEARGWNLSRPFRACQSVVGDISDPGRWPGLRWIAPSGLKFRTACVQQKIRVTISWGRGRTASGPFSSRVGEVAPRLAGRGGKRVRFVAQDTNLTPGVHFGIDHFTSARITWGWSALRFSLTSRGRGNRNSWI